MLEKTRLRIELASGVVVLGVALTPLAIAETNVPTPARSGAANFFQGRGIAQGATFAKGRNTNISLTLDGENFGLEMIEILPSNTRNQQAGRVQYRGVILRRTDKSGTPNSFSLNTRVRSFDSSANLRVLTNTTGTCRVEVFNSRVIASNCNTVANDSSTQFLGLEQF